MSDFKFYKTTEVYAETYFQLPKIFFTNDQYKNLSNDAKIAYAILKDRFQYSIKNNWVDEKNQIYFIYTNNELMNILNCYEGKLNKIKKELESKQLLFQKRLGVKKPNRLYLGKPIANAQDVYMQKQENSPESIDNTGNAKIAFQENSPESIDNTGNAKIAHNLYKESIDTLKDTYIDTDKSELQNSILLKNFSKTIENTFLNKQCLDLIAAFSTNVKEAYDKIGIIIRAKNSIQKKKNTIIIAEHFQADIEDTLLTLFTKFKIDSEKETSEIKNFDNYFYGSFEKLFNEIHQSQEWYKEHPIPANKNGQSLNNSMDDNDKSMEELEERIQKVINNI